MASFCGVLRSSLLPRARSSRRWASRLSILAQSELNVTLALGPACRTVFDYIYLYDSCRCVQCRHAQTFQKTIKSYQIPAHVRPIALETTDADELVATWSNAHRSVFSTDWIRQHAYAPKLSPETTSSPLEQDAMILWNAQTLESSLPKIAYAHIMASDDGLLAWLKLIKIYGLAFVEGVPLKNPLESTLKLMRRIAFIRETHYGAGLWDVTSKPPTSRLRKGQVDTAYTMGELALHTDTTYFTDPVGLQLIHVIEREEPKGAERDGASSFLDGFHVAQSLSPSAYASLSSVLGGGIYHETGLRPLTAMPILNHDLLTGQLVQIRYNNDDASGLSSASSSDQMQAYYSALREWGALLEDAQEENTLWKYLWPGTAVIFDNYRVLHGRSRIRSKRRFIGAYLNHDDYRARYMELQKRR